MTDSDEGNPPSNRSQPGTSTPAPSGNGSTPQTTGTKEAKKLRRSNSAVNGSSGAANNSSSRSLTVSATAPDANSSMSSRESSPARPPKRQSTGGAQRGLRPRKSSQDVSPNRTPTPAAAGGNVPSAAAIQRALSTASATRLIPASASESSSRIPRQTAQKPTGHSSGENTPHWPVPSRLKSPPPPSAPGSRRNSLLSQKKSEPDPVAPNIVVQLSTPPSSSPALVGKNEVGTSDSEQDITLQMKGSGRGASVATRTLETVQEASLPPTPGPGFESLSSLKSFDSSILNRGPDDDPTPIAAVDSVEDLPETGTQSRGSGSESGGNKSDGKRRHPVQRMTPVRTTSSSGSYVTPAPTRSRSGNDSASKNMTIETETVASIPQAAIGGPGERNATGRSEHSGSIRLKPSNETIRPKKERKKVARKAPPVSQGTASTKADIFEQKVASAVDEANSSDSDETFVYESNPPEPQPRTNRHHSRTSSTTSVASLVDHRGNIRPLTNVLESHRVAGKRSMKFATNPYNDSSPVDAPDRSDVAIRAAASRTGGGGSVHHHHIGRHGRAGPGHFDSDSPFSQHSNGRKGPRQLSRPTSPTYRNASLRLAGNGLKKNGEIPAYDIEAELADTERTPLLGSMRTPRTRTPRRPNSASLRQLEYQNQRRRRSWIRRFAACIVITIMVLLLVFGAVGFLFAMTKPLYDIEVVELQNVLASEQELIMDLLVEAINPNVVAITVAEMNVSVFAKSKYVGTDKWWREHGERLDMEPAQRRRKRRALARPAARNEGPLYHASDNVDEGTDPIGEDPEGDRQTMLIGRLYEFDSALNFDGSPFQHHPHYSVGEVRLTKPGNTTEDGGSERWERVIQHSFELIVRGVLKYELPLSSRKHTASISASTTVIPDTGGGDDGEDDDADVEKDINWHWDEGGIKATDSRV